MLLTEFDYELPEELIAQYPLEKRDTSKLLCLDRSSGCVRHSSFQDIVTDFLPSDILVLNDTKVIKARLFGRKKTGATLQLFLLSPIDTTHWKVLIKPAKRLKCGEDLWVTETETITLIEKRQDCCIIRFNTTRSVYDLLEDIGQVPIPPYIKDAMVSPNSFTETYQTVFAEKPGAVAAPTAGLHFTDALLDTLRKKGVTIVTITLHVGYGTFKPISVETIEDHHMHTETYMISQKTADILNEGLGKQRIIGVGTTSVRTLESAFVDGQIQAGEGQSNLFIYPGYTFKVITGMITNFHLPKSSLLLLVSALAGTSSIRNAYQEAISHRYRFYSFGDAMLIL